MKNKNYNNGRSQPVLKHISEEIMKKRLSEMEAVDVEEHEFSANPEFERKMRELSANVDKKEARLTIKRTRISTRAGAIAACIALFFILYTVATYSPLRNWLDVGSYNYGGNTHEPSPFVSNGAFIAVPATPLPSKMQPHPSVELVPSPSDYEVPIPYVPLGFNLIEHNISDNNEMFIYMNAGDIEICFTIASNDYDLALNATCNESLYEQEYGLNIYIFADGRHCVIWEKNGKYNMLISECNYQELIKMAKSRINLY